MVAPGTPVVHDAPVTGRLQAACGWLAWQVGRPFRRGGSRGFARNAVIGVAVLLGVLAVVPLVAPLFAAQPTDAEVDQIITGEVTEPGTWVRLRGRIFPQIGRASC